MAFVQDPRSARSHGNLPGRIQKLFFCLKSKVSRTQWQCCRDRIQDLQNTTRKWKFKIQDPSGSRILDPGCFWNLGTYLCLEKKHEGHWWRDMSSHLSVLSILYHFYPSSPSAFVIPGLAKVFHRVGMWRTLSHPAIIDRRRLECGSLSW